jgi:hypothetical protein
VVKISTQNSASISKTFVLKNTSVLLNEIVVRSKDIDKGRRLILQALQQLCAKLDPSIAYKYDLTHFIENNMGYTHYFQGQLLVLPLGMKLENRNGVEKISFTKGLNFCVGDIAKKEVYPKKEGCGDYCFLFNYERTPKHEDESDEYVGWSSYRWFDYTWFIAERIRDQNYLFEIQDESNPTQLQIKISNPQGKRELFDLVLTIDKATLDIVNIKYEISKELNKRWNNNIIAGKRLKGFIPRYIFLRQKNRVMEMSIALKIINGNIFFDKIKMIHFIEFNKLYNEKSVFKRQIIEWDLIEPLPNTPNLCEGKKIRFTNYSSLYEK